MILKLLMHFNSVFLYLGPGPARYKLPTCLGYQTHDITKRMMPAHTFGKKLGNRKGIPVFSTNANINFDPVQLCCTSNVNVCLSKFLLILYSMLIQVMLL